MLFLENLFNPKDSWSLRWIFRGVLLIVCLRVIVEWMLFSFPVQIDGFQDYVRFLLENLYYFLILFFISSILLSRLINKPLTFVMTFGVKLYPIIILPPIIDFIFFQRRSGYFYAQPENMLGNFLTFFWVHGDGSPGLSIEVMLGVLGIGVFAWLHSRSWWRVGLAVLAIELILVFLTTPDFWLGKGKGDYYYEYFLPTYYFLPFVMMVLGYLAWNYRTFFLAFLGNVRWVRAAMFMLAVYTGGMSRYFLTDRIYPLYLLLAIFSVLCVWMVSVWVNDIFDQDIDRLTNHQRPLVSGLIKTDNAWLIVDVLSFLIVSCLAVVGISTLFMGVLMIGAAHVYSRPPLRLRNHIGGNILMGVFLSLSFCLGVLATGYISDSESVLLWARLPKLAVLLVFYGLILTLVKDIKDVDGDRLAGVRNLFTVYGFQKAKMITTLLIVIWSLILGVMSQSWLVGGVSALGAMTFYRYHSILMVYVSGAITFSLIFFQDLLNLRVF